MEGEVGVLIVAEPAATAPPCGRAHAAAEAKAPVNRPAAAKPLAHLAERNFISIDGVLLFTKCGSSSYLVFSSSYLQSLCQQADTYIYANSLHYFHNIPE